MSVVGAVRDYLETYSGLANKPVWVNFLKEPTQYGIVPLPGEKVIEEYLDGGSLNEFPFAFQIIEYTTEDDTRLDTVAFTEEFADWLKSQTEAGILPEMDEGQTAESIQAVTWGYLLEQGESGTGVYQINCKLTYEQEP